MKLQHCAHETEDCSSHTAALGCSASRLEVNWGDLRSRVPGQAAGAELVSRDGKGAVITTVIDVLVLLSR